jgi:hypothetical protein
MESVYIETSIISYLVSRPNRDLLVAAHQQITHEWWRQKRQEFDCFVSLAVIEELRAGDMEAADKRMEQIQRFSVLEITEEAEYLARKIVEAGAIPRRAVRDAAHIAIATVNEIDYVLTWNCRHLANAQIIRKVSVVCNEAGYGMPVICTPEELMGV